MIQPENGEGDRGRGSLRGIKVPLPPTTLAHFSYNLASQSKEIATCVDYSESNMILFFLKESF
jgi:hypothetical protein